MFGSQASHLISQSSDGEFCFGYFFVIVIVSWKYSSAPVSTGSMFQDLLWLCETADNTEHYI
jgi:hypothetical protein